MNKESPIQSELFEPNTDFDISDVVLFALGDFQSRGFELAGRKIALDRLLGAFKRAFEIFEIVPLEDDVIAEELSRLGADVSKLQSFVAKHPYRVTVDVGLAQKAKERFDELVEDS